VQNSAEPAGDVVRDLARIERALELIRRNQNSHFSNVSHNGHKGSQSDFFGWIVVELAIDDPLDSVFEMRLAGFEQARAELRVHDERRIKELLCDLILIHPL